MLLPKRGFASEIYEITKRAEALLRGGQHRSFDASSPQKWSCRRRAKWILSLTTLDVRLSPVILWGPLPGRRADSVGHRSICARCAKIQPQTANPKRLILSFGHWEGNKEMSAVSHSSLSSGERVLSARIESSPASPGLHLRAIIELAREQLQQLTQIVMYQVFDRPLGLQELWHED
jgi:hypothetical protein